MKRPKLAAAEKARPKGSTSHREVFFQQLRVDPHELLQSQLRNNATLRASYSRHMSTTTASCSSLAAISPEAILMQCNNGMLKLWSLTNGSLSFPDFTGGSKVSRIVAAENSPTTSCLLVCNDRLDVVEVDHCHQPVYNFTSKNTNSNILDGDISSYGDVIIATSLRHGSSYAHELYDTRTQGSRLNFASYTTKGASASKPKTRMLGEGYSRVATLLDDGTVRVYDMRKPEVEYTSIQVVGKVQPARWENGRVVPASGRHPFSVMTLSSLADSDMFITGSDEDGLRVWDMTSMQCVEHFAKCDGKFEPQIVRGSNSRTFYAFSNELNTVCEWNCNNAFKERARFERPAFWTREVCCALVGNSYDGLVCGNALGQFYAWMRV